MDFDVSNPSYVRTNIYHGNSMMECRDLRTKIRSDNDHIKMNKPESFKENGPWIPDETGRFFSGRFKKVHPLYFSMEGEEIELIMNSWFALSPK